jgi:hypothetical protein
MYGRVVVVGENVIPEVEAEMVRGAAIVLASHRSVLEPELLRVDHTSRLVFVGSVREPLANAFFRWSRENNIPLKKGKASR